MADVKIQYPNAVKDKKNNLVGDWKKFAEQVEPNLYQYQELERRIRLYAGSAVGVTAFCQIPTGPTTKPANILEIDSVSPTEGTRNADTFIAVKGRGFMENGTSSVKQVLVGGVACDEITALSDKVLVARVPKGSFDDTTKGLPTFAKQSITVVTITDIVSTQPAIAFTNVRQEELEAPPPPGQFNVQRDSSGRILSIILPRDDTVDANKLLETLRTIVQSENNIGQADKVLDAIKVVIGCGRCATTMPSGK